MVNSINNIMISIIKYNMNNGLLNTIVIGKTSIYLFIY